MDITRLYTTVNGVVQQAGMPLQEIATEIDERRDLYSPELVHDTLKYIEDGRRLDAGPPQQTTPTPPPAPTDADIIAIMGEGWTRHSLPFHPVLKFQIKRALETGEQLKAAALMVELADKLAGERNLASSSFHSKAVSLLYRRAAEIYVAADATHFSPQAAMAFTKLFDFTVNTVNHTFPSDENLKTLVPLRNYVLAMALKSYDTAIGPAKDGYTITRLDLMKAQLDLRLRSGTIVTIEDKEKVSDSYAQLGKLYTTHIKKEPLTEEQDAGNSLLQRDAFYSFMAGARLARSAANHLMPRTRKVSPAEIQGRFTLLSKMDSAYQEAANISAKIGGDSPNQECLDGWISALEDFGEMPADMTIPGTFMKAPEILSERLFRAADRLNTYKGFLAAAAWASTHLSSPSHTMAWIYRKALPLAEDNDQRTRNLHEIIKCRLSTFPPAYMYDPIRIESDIEEYIKSSLSDTTKEQLNLGVTLTNHLEGFARQIEQHHNYEVASHVYQRAAEVARLLPNRDLLLRTSGRNYRDAARALAKTGMPLHKVKDLLDKSIESFIDGYRVSVASERVESEAVLRDLLEFNVEEAFLAVAREYIKRDNLAQAEELLMYRPSILKTIAIRDSAFAFVPEMLLCQAEEIANKADRRNEAQDLFNRATKAALQRLLTIIDTRGGDIPVSEAGEFFELAQREIYFYTRNKRFEEALEKLTDLNAHAKLIHNKILTKGLLKNWQDLHIEERFSWQYEELGRKLEDVGALDKADVAYKQAMAASWLTPQLVGEKREGKFVLVKDLYPTRFKDSFIISEYHRLARIAEARAGVCPSEERAGLLYYAARILQRLEDPTDMQKIRALFGDAAGSATNPGERVKALKRLLDADALPEGPADSAAVMSDGKIYVREIVSNMLRIDNGKDLELFYETLAQDFRPPEAARLLEAALEVETDHGRRGSLYSKLSTALSLSDKPLAVPYIRQNAAAEYLMAGMETEALEQELLEATALFNLLRSPAKHIDNKSQLEERLIELYCHNIWGLFLSQIKKAGTIKEIQNIDLLLPAERLLSSDTQSTVPQRVKKTARDIIVILEVKTALVLAADGQYEAALRSLNALQDPEDNLFDDKSEMGLTKGEKEALLRLQKNILLVMANEVVDEVDINNLLEVTGATDMGSARPRERSAAGTRQLILKLARIELACAAFKKAANGSSFDNDAEIAALDSYVSATASYLKTDPSKFEAQIVGNIAAIIRSGDSTCSALEATEMARRLVAENNVTIETFKDTSLADWTRTNLAGYKRRHETVLDSTTSVLDWEEKGLEGELDRWPGLEGESIMRSGGGRVK